MKKLLLAAMLFPLFTQAQWNVNLYGGFSNYVGDMQHRAYTTKEAHGSFGAGLQYDLTGHFSVLSNLTYAKVSASDAKDNSTANRARNLSFETKIGEWNLLLEYNLLDLSQHRFTPYAFAGIAVYHFDPYAYDSTGKKVYLHILSTEGEGLPQYPDRKPYSLTQMAIPFGGGFKFRISDRVTLAYEIGLRVLFTDHLDDLSNSYIDQATLLAERGPQAVEMAYRGGELKNGAPYPSAGAFRGNSKHKDFYYTSGLRVTIALPSGLPIHHRHNGVIDCPKKVY
jgi:hypothetical protein